jgi:hypothetical protein
MSNPIIGAIGNLPKRDFFENQSAKEIPILISMHLACFHIRTIARASAY